MMDNDISFFDVRNKSKNALQDELLKYSSELYSTDVVTDNDKCYRVIIRWEKCIGELVVETPDYAPYRYISFNILSCVSDNETPIYCWLDSENDALDIIEQKIRNGIVSAFNYSKQ